MTNQPSPHRVSHGRLDGGIWSAEFNKHVGEGDISAAYSADTIGMQGTIRRPFVFRGGLWVNVAQGGGQVKAYRLVPFDDHEERPGSRTGPTNAKRHGRTRMGSTTAPRCATGRTGSCSPGHQRFSCRASPSSRGCSGICSRVDTYARPGPRRAIELDAPGRERRDPHVVLLQTNDWITLPALGLDWTLEHVDLHVMRRLEYEQRRRLEPERLASSSCLR